MARTRRTQEKDVISRVADSGEDALRRLVELPRRIAAQAKDDVEEALHDLGVKVREIDPLYRRVTDIERRLDALEKTKRPTTRRRSTRAKPATARATPAAEPQQSAHEVSRRDDQARPEGTSAF
jgi:uncharacterized membrane protein